MLSVAAVRMCATGTHNESGKDKKQVENKSQKRKKSGERAGGVSICKRKQRKRREEPLR